ncbi:MAG: hypothetical protein LDL38_02985 [Flavobacterium piscis]|nr:hypothetical protein [Flavobacterium piscis]
MIKKIEISNIRGIGVVNNKFECNLKPNRACFFVAPNGFGKSSIASAFNSLGNRNRIALDKKDFHKKDNKNLPELRIQFNDEVLTADDNRNEILKHFDIKVINNCIYPKVRRKRLESGFNVETAELKIYDVTIIEKIPHKKTFDYKITEIKKIINSKNNEWINIRSLIGNIRFMLKVNTFIKQFDRVSKFKKIESFIKLNQSLDENNIKKIESEDLKSLVDIICVFTKKNIIESTLIAIQLIYLYKKDSLSFNEVMLYYKFIFDKIFIDSFFYGDKDMWKDLKPRIINITEKKGNKILYKNYGIQFPNADEISNGERDVVVFLSSLIQSFININFKKKNFILVIDEVFDYLDDANLIIVQYFLNQFIEKCSLNDVNIYPILLTHLDPYYFSTYSFQKFDVVYLNKWKQQKDINIESLVILRNKVNRKTSVGENLYGRISKHFIHFSPDSYSLDIEEIKECLKIEKRTFNNKLKDLIDSDEFKSICLNSLESYTNNKKDFEPLSVCIGLRIVIEEIVYNLLDEKFREEFLEQNETLKKLKLAKNHIDVSGDFFLLSSIYNETLHIKNEQDNNSRLFLKLNNQFIRKMIKNILFQYKNIVRI